MLNRDNDKLEKRNVDFKKYIKFIENRNKILGKKSLAL